MFSNQCMYTSLILLVVLAKICSSHSTNALLLVVSFDGFRWDYLNKMKQHERSTPNFDKLISSGAKAKYVKPVFPPKTFPTHMSIVTGLHSESHGVVANTFHDPVLQESFSYVDFTQSSQGKWFDNDGTVEPLWITNQRGAQTIFPKRSGVILWPGGEASYGHMLPHKWMSSQERKTCDSLCRITKIVDWMATEEDPINLGFVYINEIDAVGHEFGVKSDEVLDSVAKHDELLGYLIDKLEKHHLYDKVNLIITSDHGMADVNHLIEMDKYVKPPLYKNYGESPIWGLQPTEGKEIEFSTSLKKLEQTENQDQAMVKVYKKSEMPAKFHYSKHRRIMEHQILVSEGCQLVCNKTKDQPVAADHGYDNDLPSQRAIFLARGPAFKRGYETEGGVSQLDLYPLMCHLLDLRPRPHNGSLEAVEDMMAEEHDNFYITTVTFLVSVVLAATVSGVFCVAACRVYRISRYVRRRQIVGVRLSDIQDGAGGALLVSDDDEIP